MLIIDMLKSNSLIVRIGPYNKVLPKKTKKQVDCWTFHALICCSFNYVVEEEGLLDSDA